MVSQATSDIKPTISVTPTTTITTTSEEGFIVEDELSKIQPNLILFHKPPSMVVAVANHIDMVNKDIEKATSTMFTSSRFPEKSIPKPSSTSCLSVSWKSNQTDLTTELAHTYNFQNHTTFYNGHPKLKAIQGKAYELDLADSLYCSCSTIPIKFGTMDLQDKPAAKIILDPTFQLQLPQLLLKR